MCSPVFELKLVKPKHRAIEVVLNSGTRKDFSAKTLTDSIIQLNLRDYIIIHKFIITADS